MAENQTPVFSQKSFPPLPKSSSEKNRLQLDSISKDVIDLKNDMEGIKCEYARKDQVARIDDDVERLSGLAVTFKKDIEALKADSGDADNLVRSEQAKNAQVEEIQKGQKNTDKKIEALENLVAALRHDILSLAAKADSADKANVSLYQQVRVLKQRLENEKKENSFLEAEMKQLKNEIVRCKEEIAANSQSASKSVQPVDPMCGENSQLRVQMSSHQTVVKDINNMLEKQLLKTEMVYLNNEISNLKNEVRILSNSTSIRHAGEFKVPQKNSDLRKSKINITSNRLNIPRKGLNQKDSTNIYGQNLGMTSSDQAYTGRNMLSNPGWQVAPGRNVSHQKLTPAELALKEAEKAWGHTRP